MPRTVWLLIGARAINRLGAFSMTFLTVLVATEFGVPATTAGLVAAAFGVATIPSRLLGGYLADRVGRRATILLGLLGCAVAQAGIAVAPSLAVLTLFAVLLGLAFELYEPPSQAMIADEVPVALRTRAYSLLNAAMAAAGLGAGLIAAAVGRWDLRWLFVVDAVTCLACAVVVRLVLPSDRPARRGPARPAVWRDRALLAMLGIGTVFATVYMTIVMVLPLTLAVPADAGILSTVAALTLIAGQPLVRRQSLTLGFVLLAANLVGYGFADSLPELIAVTVLGGIGESFLMGRLMAIVADLAPDDARGRYLAFYGICWGFATVIAPLAGTWLLELAGARGLWLTLAGVTLALAAGTARARVTRVAQPSALR
ncbi:MFS transporter [Nonomuraea sp. NPDC050663]|uniref:MFS transporter n=1 Tax=Nonomuraea sp. NPDC050663 TaxID=3364370 RepID=UPI0037A12CD1